MTSTISSKGQITVPKSIRSELGLQPGIRVAFELRDGGVFLRKDPGGQEHPIDQAFGILTLEKSVDETLDDLRGPRPESR